MKRRGEGVRLALEGAQEDVVLLAVAQQRGHHLHRPVCLLRLRGDEMQREMQRAPRPHRAAWVPRGRAGRGDEDELGALHQLLADLLRLTLAHRGEEVLGLLWVRVRVKVRVRVTVRARVRVRGRVRVSSACSGCCSRSRSRSPAPLVWPLLRVVKRCFVGHQPSCVCPDFGLNLFGSLHSLHRFRFSLAALHGRFAGGATSRNSKGPEESSTEDPRFGNPGSRSGNSEKSSLIHPDICGCDRRRPRLQAGEARRTQQLGR